MPTRKKQPERTVTIETWTWEQAQEALLKNNTNRRLYEGDVEKYARSMSTVGGDNEPLWGMDAHPIVFDWDGNLIDGQHRLTAQVKTKTTQEWLVYRNVPPETQKNINTGKVRSVADQLKLEGRGNSIVLASVARWGWMLENDMTASGKLKVSSEEIVDMVHRHPDLEHSAHMGVYARTGFVEMTPTPIGAAHWWIAQHNNHAEADIFVDRFVHMNREGDGSPVLALMKRFADARRQRMLVPTRVQIAMVIKTWNYDVQRKWVSKINMYSRTGEYKLQDVLTRTVSQTVETPLEETETSDPD